MMSYLWILLLGSLLATSAKAQEDVDQTDDAATPEAPEAPEADSEPEVKGEPDADEEGDQTAEEIPPTVSEPAADPEAGGDNPTEGDVEPTPAAGDTETVTPAAGDAEPQTTAAGDAEPETPAAGDAEPETPAAGDAEPVTPAAGDAQPETPAPEDAELVTLAAVDTPAEAAATTQEPAVVPEVNDPEQPTANGEEEPTSSNDATSAQEDSGADDKAITEPGPAAEKTEEPTDPAASVDPTDTEIVDVEKIVPDVRADVNADVGLNLENPLANVDNPSRPGNSRSMESEAHVAGATGDDKPEAKEAGSGTLAGVLSTIGVAVVGAVTGYFTYQKKKLCFKNRQEADPEAARKADAAEAQSDPQVLSNLLNSS